MVPVSVIPLIESIFKYQQVTGSTFLFTEVKIWQQMLQHILLKLFEILQHNSHYAPRDTTNCVWIGCPVQALTSSLLNTIKMPSCSFINQDPEVMKLRREIKKQKEIKVQLVKDIQEKKQRAAQIMLRIKLAQDKRNKTWRGS